MRLTVAQAAERLRAGDIVAFPTETVYGLGANALDAVAVAKIYAAKRRPATSPLIVHVASVEMARSLVTEWPALAEQLAARWWPGPLTLVLPKQPSIPDAVTAGLPTVGIRMPAHPVALELIRAAGVPLAAPSANRFTQLSPTTAEHVEQAFDGAVDVVDGGPSAVGIESTVVAIENGRPILLRPGMVSLGEIEQAAAEAGAAHPAPGMHERHYSPRTPLLLVDGPDDLPGRNGAYVFHSAHALCERAVRLPAEPHAYAAQLYAVLHELDQEGLPWIAVERVPATPEWSAIADRLQRAASRVAS